MKFNSKALYAGVLAGVMVIPTIAVGADSYASASTNQTSNTATGAGLNDLRNNLMSVRDDEATGYSTGGGTVSGDAVAVSGSDIEKAILSCEVPEAQDKAVKDAIQMATIGVNVDGIFNSGLEKAQGCFAATQEMINLAVEVPNISSIFDAGAALLQQKVNDLIQQKVDEVVDKGCEIAMQAARDTIAPLADFIEEYENTLDEAYSVFGEYADEARSQNTEVRISASDYLRNIDLGLGTPTNAGSGNVSNSSRASTPTANTSRSVGSLASNPYDSGATNSNTGHSERPALATPHVNPY